MAPQACELARAAKLVGWAEPAAGDGEWCSDADRARTRPRDSDGAWPDAAVVVEGAAADGYREGGGGGGARAVGVDVGARLDAGRRYGLVRRAW